MTIFNKPTIIKIENQNTQVKSEKSNVIILNLDEILNLIKQNKTLHYISNNYGVDDRTINNFLEDRSYVIRWAGSSSRHNQIRYATKLIWPTEELPPREVFRNRSNYEWDNYEWLYNKYIIEKLSTRTIGKMVNKSGRLILKKLRKHNINKIL